MIGHKLGEFSLTRTFHRHGGKMQKELESKKREAEISAAKSADLDIITYQLTESGAALQATLQGTKYWKHRDLNL